MSPNLYFYTNIQSSVSVPAYFDTPIVFSRHFSEAFKNLIFQAPVQTIPGGCTNTEFQVGGGRSGAKRYKTNTQIEVDSKTNPNDKNYFLKYIDRSSESTFSQNFITFNTEGLKNDKNSLEYLMIFKKNAYVFVNDVRLTPDKEVILNELAT